MKFTIRELFLVTLCVALAVGWWLNRNEFLERLNAQKQNQNRINAELQNHASVVESFVKLVDIAYTPKGTTPALDPQEVLIEMRLTKDNLAKRRARLQQ